MATFQLASTAISSTENKFVNSFELINQQHTLVLDTENTFIDQNIELEFNVKDGAVTNTATIAVTPYIEEISTSETAYYTVSVSAVNSVTPCVIENGFIAQSEVQVIAGDIITTGSTIMPQSIINEINIIPYINIDTTAVVSAGYCPNDRYIIIKGMNAGEAANITSNIVNYKAPHVAINSTATMQTTSSITPYYFTITGTPKNGCLNTKYNVTSAGYASIHSAVNSTTQIIAPTTNSSTAIYIVESNLSTTVTGGIINNSINTTQTKGIDIKSSSNYNNGIMIGLDLSVSKIGIESFISEGYTTTASLSTTYTCGASTAIYYVDGVTLNKPAIGTTSTFYLTFPNGTNDTMTFNFTIDSNGNVTIS